MTRDLGRVDDFADGTATPLVLDAQKVVVVRVGEMVYVLEDRCSHEDFPLSLGEVNVETCEIECERHGSMFHLASGLPSSFPATRPVATFDARVEDGHVLVELP